MRRLARHSHDKYRASERLPIPTSGQTVGQSCLKTEHFVDLRSGSASATSIDGSGPLSTLTFGVGAWSSRQFGGGADDD
jgi:hypothetical protein